MHGNFFNGMGVMGSISLHFLLNENQIAPRHLLNMRTVTSSLLFFS